MNFFGWCKEGKNNSRAEERRWWEHSTLIFKPVYATPAASSPVELHEDSFPENLFELEIGANNPPANLEGKLQFEVKNNGSSELQFQKIIDSAVKRRTRYYVCKSLPTSLHFPPRDRSYRTEWDLPNLALRRKGVFYWASFPGWMLRPSSLRYHIVSSHTDIAYMVAPAAPDPKNTVVPTVPIIRKNEL